MSETAYDNSDPGDETSAEAPAAEAPETTAAPPAAEETPSWSGPSQQEWEQAQQLLYQQQQALEQLYGPQEDYQQYEPPELDITDPDSIQQYIEHQIEQRVQQQVGPFQPLLGSIAEQEGERIARERLSAMSDQYGQFDHDQAILVTQTLLGQGYGPDQAIQVAAQNQIAYEKKIAEAAVEAYKQQLEAAAGAPQTPAAPGVGAAAETLPTPTGRGRYEEVLARYESNRAPYVP